MAVRVYHGRVSREGGGWFYLLCGILQGLGFVYLQLWELWECRCDITYCSYYGASFSTVGLHFFHVVLGLFILGYVLLKRQKLSFYYTTLRIWYWHFVDYIWLFVYTFVYVI